jgi:hypothetical protein
MSDMGVGTSTTTGPGRSGARVVPSLQVLARQAVEQTNYDLEQARDLLSSWLLANDYAILNAILMDVVKSAISVNVTATVIRDRKKATTKAKNAGSAQSTPRVRALAQAAFVTRCFWDEYRLGDGTLLGDATKPQLAADIAVVAKHERNFTKRREFEQAIHDALPNNHVTVRNSGTSDEMIRRMWVQIEEAA